VTAPQPPDALLGVIRRLFAASRRVRVASILGVLLLRVYLLRPRPPVVVDVMGVRMELDPMDVVDRGLLVYPWLWDPKEIQFMREHLAPGSVFVDAGAHVGFYALMAGRCVGPTGRVLAIEADPKTYETLARNARLNGELPVIPVHAALAESRRRLVLSRNPAPNKGGNSVLFEYPGGDRVEVDGVSLVDLLDEHAIDRPDGIKLDLEGYEFKVLQSFFQRADAARFPSFVIVEHVTSLDAEAGGDVVALLIEHGYRISGRQMQNVMLLRD
jgi:FkbM family methyltransferase